MKLRDIDLSDIVMAVIGDQNLDVDYVGDLSGQMSRELESLPIHDSNSANVRYSGGGAANIVQGLAHLGARVYPVGLWNVWCDLSSYRLYDILTQHSHVDLSHMRDNRNIPAFIKFYRPSGAHIFRANVSVDPITDDQQESLIHSIRGLKGKPDIAIVADYDEDGKGIITPEVLYVIREHLDCPLIGISRRRLYRMNNFDYLIMNEEELQAATTDKLDDEQARIDEMLCTTGAGQLVITMRGTGAACYSHDGNDVAIPSLPVSGTIDSCGCGDSFTMIFALCIAAGMSIQDAIKYSNAAGRAQATKLYGAQLITMEEVEREYMEIYGESKEVIDSTI